MVSRILLRCCSKCTFACTMLNLNLTSEDVCKIREHWQVLNVSHFIQRKKWVVLKSLLYWSTFWIKFRVPWTVKAYSKYQIIPTISSNTGLWSVYWYIPKYSVFFVGNCNGVIETAIFQNKLDGRAPSMIFYSVIGHFSNRIFFFHWNDTFLAFWTAFTIYYSRISNNHTLA